MATRAVHNDERVAKGYEKVVLNWHPLIIVKFNGSQPPYQLQYIEVTMNLLPNTLSIHKW